MDKEQLKQKIDFNNIQELEYEVIKGLPETIIKTDYLVDDKDNFIIPLNPLEFKLIEKIKDLENRMKILEKG